MKKVLAILLSTICAAPALAGTTMLTCNAQKISVIPSDSLELVIMEDSIPETTVASWDSPAGTAVVAFCLDGQLTIGAEGAEKVRLVLSVQTGATLER